jgi:hypothetical protein
VRHRLEQRQLPIQAVAVVVVQEIMVQVVLVVQV